MPDKVSEAYKALKGNQLFLDEADFREQVTKSPKDVFNVLSKDKSAGQLFLDYDDFETSLGLKKKDGGIPVTTISENVLKTGFVPQSSVPSSATLSPLEIPRPQGQSEKVRVEAAPKPKETKYGGSGVLNIGEPYTGKPSERTQRLIEAGGAFKPETKEKDLIRRSIEKGSLQGELANALPIDSKPNAEQLKKIANINKKMASLPQSDAEKAFQKDGFGVFKKDPLLGAEYLLETIITSGASLFESAKRTAGAGVVTGAAMGAPIAGIGALAGAATGLTAGISAGGVNLSTSSKIMELLNESGVDISDEDSLIAAFSDEKKMAQLRKKAADYALPIFYFDLAAAGLAGRFANKAVGKSVGKKVLAATKEVGLQSAAGSAGELTGQLASGQKVNWSDVAMEGIASIATDAPELVRPIGSLVVGRKNASSNNKTIVKQVVNLGEEVGKQDAVENLKRDLNNGVISEEEYKQGLEVVEKAAEVAKNAPPDLSPKEKVEIIQSVVEDREPNFGMGDVTDDEYNVFIDKGIVTEERLNDIAKKVKEQDQLDEREKAIFTSYTWQINDIIAQEEAQPSYTQEEISKPIELSPELPEGYTLPLTQPEEQITTEEQFKEPLVETVEEESQVIPLQEQQKSQDITLQKEDNGKISVEILSSEEPPMKDGVRISTLSGMTEAERIDAIEARKKETKVSDKVLQTNALVMEAKSYFDKGGRYQNSTEGRNKLNELRNKARALGLEIDTTRNAVVRKKEGSARVTKVVYNSKAEGDAIIEEGAKVLTERDRSVQEVFEELLESDVFLDIAQENGTRMSASQVEATIKDILDGIPSKRANRYLDMIEKAIQEDAFPIYDKTFGELSPRLSDIREQLGVKREVVGEPIDEKALMKFLEEESQLTPQEEQELLDNVENLLYEYETINERGTEAEVSKPKSESEARVSAKAEPITETKQAEPTKSIKDKFKDIADINLSDNPEVVKKREVTKYLKDNPEIADVVKNFRKVTDYLEAQGELKKSSPDC